MTLDTIYQYSLSGLFIFSVITFLGSFFYTTPYGKFKKPDEKFEIASLPGWLIMEFPCIVACLITFITAGGNNKALVPLVFLAIWQAHYTYRSLIFPFLLNERAKKMPLSAVAFGVGFNSLNGFLNGYAFTHLDHLLDSSWLLTPMFIGGVSLMIIGLSINMHADKVLRHLRKPGETGYKIPHGGMYKYISVPNYFGEMIEWAGLALASCSPAALAFLVFTIANLFPRALAHHKWYLNKFEDYPQDRKAIIPFIL